MSKYYRLWAELNNLQFWATGQGYNRSVKYDEDPPMPPAQAEPPSPDPPTSALREYAYAANRTGTALYLHEISRNIVDAMQILHPDPATSALEDTCGYVSAALTTDAPAPAEPTQRERIETLLCQPGVFDDHAEGAILAALSGKEPEHG
jgi:hypothetical protein